MMSSQDLLVNLFNIQEGQLVLVRVPLANFNDHEKAYAYLENVGKAFKKELDDKGWKNPLFVLPDLGAQSIDLSMIGPLQEGQFLDIKLDLNKFGNSEKVAYIKHVSGQLKEVVPGLKFVIRDHSSTIVAKTD